MLFRSEAFLFAFLELEQYLEWYRLVLEETVDFKRSLQNINMKNCIGTVLAVNGPRKYYCIYHAVNERRKRAAGKKRAALGNFLGLDASESDSSGAEAEVDPNAHKLFESDLLHGLGHWMDRLCEGTLKRFKVSNWPAMDPHNN